MERGGPYPQVILPEFGGYWIEDPEAPTPPPLSLEISLCERDEGEDGEETPPGAYGYRLESNDAARAYRKHFLGKVRAVNQSNQSPPL